MKTKQLISLCTIGLSAVFAVSCGGSEDGPLLTGVFLDSPVGGVEYVTPTKSGVTNAAGQFYYRAGEAVVFSIGNLALPVVVASDVVTPLDIVGSEDINDERVVNLARLLQSFDDDLDPSNGIMIKAHVAQGLREGEVFDTEDSTAVADAVQLVFGNEREPVSAEAAQAHFADTLSDNANSTASLDQLQYLVPVDEHYVGDSLFVDENGFSLTLDGATHTGAAGVNKGVYQLSGTEENWFVSVADVDDTRHACIAKAPTSVAKCGDGAYRVFVEEEQAELFGAESGSDLETGAATDADLSENTQEPTSEETPTGANPEIEFPVCDHRIEDPDGDGYGWQLNQSCVIPEAETDAAGTDSQGESVVPATSVPEATDNQPEPQPVEVPEPQPEPQPVKVPEPQPEPQPVDVPEPQPEPQTVVVPEPQPEPEPVDVAITPADITDLIVLTGQTNAAAYDTAFDATLDATDQQVMAYVEGNGWQVADLHQYWDGSLPGNYADSDSSRTPVNNLAFQMAKSLAANSDRVVGIIMVTAPGEGISHWDYDSEFYRKIRSKVSDALSALPQKDTIDAMVWAQGETDWLFEGTADTGATGFGSEDTDFYRDYYPNKLSQLISNLRSEVWFAGQAKFLCTETKKAGLNPHLMALNSDDSDLTACASASDLATRPEDPFGSQFSAASLRILGGRIADLYLGISP